MGPEGPAGIGSDEVAITPTDPGATYELWYDTDAPVPPSNPVSADPGNDLILGTDGKPYYDGATTVYFQLWLATNQALTIDGETNIAFTDRLDPFGITSGATFVAPKSGLVLMSASILFSMSGSPTSVTLYLNIKESSTAIRRGSQVTGGLNMSWYQSVLSTQVVVTAGRSYSVSAYAAVPSFSKTAYGGRAYTYFEGAYL
jgi:hypothetical protein